MALYDLFPTIADIAGYEHQLPDIDGVSFASILTGKGNSPEHDFIVSSSYYGPTLITNDGWKIRTFLPQNAFELYFLPNDYREEKNLAELFPNKLEELKDKLLNACDGDLENGWYKGSNQISLDIQKLIKRGNEH